MKDFYCSVFSAARASILEYLTDYALFSQELSHPVLGMERGSNIQYSFDVKIDAVIRSKIEKSGLQGVVFSEESGFYVVGSEKTHRIVFDPFCNSTLASRGILDSACGLSVFSWDYRLLASGILDYQTGIVALYEVGKTTRFFSLVSGDDISVRQGTSDSLEDAWVVLVLENQAERAGLGEIKTIFDSAKRILVGSGHIYWLRLAMGTVDAYLDPVGGEQLYEMFAASVAQGAGCIVTDRDGEVFDSGKYLKVFEQNQNFRYYPIAARTESLHAILFRSQQKSFS